MPLGKIFGYRCARCGIARTKQQLDGVPTCDKCKLEIEAEREDRRQCPMCQTIMEKRVVLNVIVDRCPGCHGAWLDGGELDLLKKAIDEGAGGDFATGMLMGMSM